MNKYALLDKDGQTVIQYPMQLRPLFPNISWPQQPTDADLARHNVVRVAVDDRPPSDVDDVVTELPPEKVGGAWRQRWQSTKDTSRLDALKADAAAGIREDGFQDWLRRNAVLAKKYQDAIAAVQAATTAAEVRAAQATLEDGAKEVRGAMGLR